MTDTAPSEPKTAVRKIRIVVADDNTMYRRNVCMMIGFQPDMEVVAEAENGWSAIEQVRLHLPDLVLIDIRMPCIDGIQATREIRARFPHVRVVAMSAFEDCDYGDQVRRIGAAAYLDKNSVLKELLATIRQAAAGSAPPV
jgi:DNA-binding NarL/FixJ family response regulator